MTDGVAIYGVNMEDFSIVMISTTQVLILMYKYNILKLLNNMFYMYIRFDGTKN